MASWQRSSSFLSEILFKSIKILEINQTWNCRIDIRRGVYRRQPNGEMKWESNRKRPVSVSTSSLTHWTVNLQDRSNFSTLSTYPILYNYIMHVHPMWLVSSNPLHSIMFLTFLFDVYCFLQYVENKWHFLQKNVNDEAENTEVGTSATKKSSRGWWSTTATSSVQLTPMNHLLSPFSSTLLPICPIEFPE